MIITPILQSRDLRLREVETCPPSPASGRHGWNLSLRSLPGRQPSDPQLVGRQRGAHSSQCCLAVPSPQEPEPLSLCKGSKETSPMGTPGGLQGQERVSGELWASAWDVRNTLTVTLGAPATGQGQTRPARAFFSSILPLTRS